MEKEILKPKTQRQKRTLKVREAKIHENDKKTLFLRGGNTSDIVTTALKELYLLKKPNAILFRKRNITRPFEDPTSMEFFFQDERFILIFIRFTLKKETTQFSYGTYDHQLLDMVEFGVENYQSLQSLKGNKCALATKPCLIFSGSDFETEDEMRRVQSLLTDFFRGPVVPNVRLSGLEHIIQFTAIDGKVLMRSYRVALKKSGTKIPRIELEDMGPNMDFTIRRTHLASNDLFKKACRKPKAAKAKKVKNVSGDMFGTKRGRIHMTSQDLGDLQLRKVKALKRKTDEEGATKKTSKRTKRK